MSRWREEEQARVNVGPLPRRPSPMRPDTSDRPALGPAYASVAVLGALSLFVFLVELCL